MDKIGADMAIRDRLLQMGTEVGVSVDLYDIGRGRQRPVSSAIAKDHLTGTNRLILRTVL
jgi:hypothetical protein